jgi:putative SOS response-associated peptidase YedK
MLAANRAGRTSVRKAKEGEITTDRYAFVTTDANADVAPIRPKAMPVVLTTEEEVDVWLRAPAGGGNGASKAARGRRAQDLGQGSAPG